ncbi:hypothetical protein N7G274_008176 [Stereocaulon virgatum]|uniref:Cardiolipin synthase n=1 Tax=Stereocaulon virgatum TaxID=373712 RepID=A0ABR3ZZN8_9LECA
MASAASAFASRALPLKGLPPCALPRRGLGRPPRESTGIATGKRGFARWTGHERIRSAREGAGGGRCGGQGHWLLLKNGAQRRLTPQQCSVTPWGQQLRCLFDNDPRRPEPQESKKKTPLSTLLPSHENIYTLPNILTLSRLIAAPVVGYLIIHDLHIPALSLFIYAGVTDLVDGWIARRWDLQTVVGTVIDPMADKALMTVVTVCLAVKGVLPVTLAVIILGRDVLLGLSAFYYRYISLPPPRTLARYWDFSLPSAEVRPTRISKINTFLQLGLIGVTMSGLAMGGLGETGQAMLEISWWIVGATTVWSGGSYIWGKDAVRIISRR